LSYFPIRTLGRGVFSSCGATFGYIWSSLSSKLEWTGKLIVDNEGISTPSEVDEEPPSRELTFRTSEEL
jgi:hypothetical protein